MPRRVALEGPPRDVRGARSEALVPLPLGRGHAGEEGEAGRVRGRDLEPALDRAHRHLGARRRAVPSRAGAQGLGGERGDGRRQLVRARRRRSRVRAGTTGVAFSSATVEARKIITPSSTKRSSSAT